MAISGSYDELTLSAAASTDDFLAAAVRSIDKQMGAGFAKDHPELVAAFLSTASAEYRNAALIVAIQESTKSVATSLKNIGDSLYNR
jgi:molybdopterin biosynthesis enzyme MoaB